MAAKCRGVLSRDGGRCCGGPFGWLNRRVCVGMCVAVASATTVRWPGGCRCNCRIVDEGLSGMELWLDGTCGLAIGCAGRGDCIG